jgi:predicted dehydrogenase
MRFAILGSGSIGRRHYKNLRQLGLRDLFVFDPSVEALELLQREINEPVCMTQRLDEVWDFQPTAVLIASPSHLHVSLAREAAEHGCHLFIEKPLSHTREGIDALQRIVEQSGLITMVGCNMRFHPGPQTVKRMLEESVIGSPIAARIQTGSYLPEWRLSHNYRHSYSASPDHGGAILDCIHEIDLALWYFGPAHVIGAAHLRADVIGLNTDGLAEIILQHESGVLDSVHLNFIQRDYRRTCQVIGTEGTLYWDFGAHQVTHYNEDGQIAEVIREIPGWAVNQMYIDEIDYFLDRVRQGTQTMNTIAGGAASLEIALAVRASRQAGKESPIS